MSITVDILGDPGRDNALFVRVDSGQSVDRLLFDCGDGCVNTLTFAEIQSIDHLFFSHLHMDHVAGFDHFFRCVFNRTSKPNRIWGPPDTARILHHRFQGFLWNLHADMSGTWQVSDISRESIHSTRFELSEAFETPHDEGTTAYQRVILDAPGYVIEAVTMDHRTPTIAYLVRERPRYNVDTDRLTSMGLRPGPWMKQLKESTDPTANIIVDGETHSIAALRAALLVETPGDSVAYLTDFLLDGATTEMLSAMLHGCHTIICEAQYRHADLELARKNFHMTTILSAQLARQAAAGKLVLFHLSDRYQPLEWIEMLVEAREHFPATEYPLHWHLDQD